MTKQIACAASLFLFALLLSAQNTKTLFTDAPVYVAGGNLATPVHYREWIYLTSGIDMSYTAKAADTTPDHSIFDNVFVNPTAYRSFSTTGKWPDKTIMVLEARSAEKPVSINTRGHTQSTKIAGMEIHVKDHGRWSFYDVSGNSSVAKLIPPPADCYTCHEAHGAVDTTFVQFYPTLLPLATQKKTLSSAYLRELHAAASIARQPTK